MRTVQGLINELLKFPLKAKCFAYEGECTGIVIEWEGKQGVIHCGELRNEDEVDPPTELF